MNLEEVLQLQVLKRKAMASGRGAFKEHIIESGETTLPLRQMCAKVSAELYAELENVCTALDMSKREFIEAAVSDAVNRAHEHIEKSGGLEALGFTPSQGSL